MKKLVFAIFAVVSLLFGCKNDADNDSRGGGAVYIDAAN